MSGCDSSKAFLGSASIVVDREDSWGRAGNGVSEADARSSSKDTIGVLPVWELVLVVGSRYSVQVPGAEGSSVGVNLNEEVIDGLGSNLDVDVVLSVVNISRLP